MKDKHCLKTFEDSLIVNIKKYAEFLTSLKIGLTETVFNTRLALYRLCDLFEQTKPDQKDVHTFLTEGLGYLAEKVTLQTAYMFSRLEANIGNLDLCIFLMSLAHKSDSVVDRLRILIRKSDYFLTLATREIVDGRDSPIFAQLFSLEWFVALWNETPVQTISVPSYREELHLAFLEGASRI